VFSSQAKSKVKANLHIASLGVFYHVEQSVSARMETYFIRE